MKIQCVREQAHGTVLGARIDDGLQAMLASERGEECGRLLRLVKHAKDRDMIRFWIWDDMSFVQIGAKYGVGGQCVSVRIRRGLLQMRVAADPRWHSVKRPDGWYLKKPRRVDVEREAQRERFRAAARRVRERQYKECTALFDECRQKPQ